VLRLESKKPFIEKGIDKPNKGKQGRSSTPAYILKARGQSKLRVKQSKNNAKFSQVRAQLELPFAYIKNS